MTSITFNDNGSYTPAAPALPRRTLSAGLAVTVAAALVGVNSHGAKKSPDAELLAVCASLGEKQAHWQRLYDATSSEGELTTPADHAWQHYCDHVWPLIHSNSFTAPVGVIDLPARLLTLCATTPEGFRAKAAAILALDDAGSYCDLRDDAYSLMLSLLRDIAGDTYRPLGDAAAATPLPDAGP